MIYKKTIGKREFTYECDYDKILKELIDSKDNFEEDTYVRYYETNDYLSKEEYEENINDLIAVLDKLNTIEYAENCIENSSKKKNGTFNLKNLFEVYDCDNCHYFCEWHNSWSFYRLKIKATSDTHILVSYDHTVSTPC